MGLSTVSYLRIRPTSLGGGKVRPAKGKMDTVYILVTRRKINSEVLIQTMLLTVNLRKSVETPFYSA